MKKRLHLGRRLKVYIEPVDIWVGVHVVPSHVYVCPLPLLVFRWARRSACEYEFHSECTGCQCYCHEPSRPFTDEAPF